MLLDNVRAYTMTATVDLDFLDPSSLGAPKKPQRILP